MNAIDLVELVGSRKQRVETCDFKKDASSAPQVHLGAIIPGKKEKKKWGHCSPASDARSKQIPSFLFDLPVSE